jgi:hypothetical protein
MGLLHAAGGLVVGLLFSTMALAVGNLAQQMDGREVPFAGALGAMFGLGVIVALPILYGVLGFIAGVIGGLLYNVAAGLVGGIRIEVDATAGR